MRSFPMTRLRRLRGSPALRGLRRETRLSREDFICPVFVVENPLTAGPVASMPGVVRYTLDSLPARVQELRALGIRALMLFGIPERKDDHGSQAYAPDGLIVRAIATARRAADDGQSSRAPDTRDMIVIADLCLCEYTAHGHCGIVRGTSIDNDETLSVLARTATVYARAGADLVAPSGMMDGMVAAIRRALDEAGCGDTGILSYTVKYASSFYGPFRDAAECAPRFGDRRSHQMDPGNAREAIAEAELDLDEGADVLMVKPALPYLDVIRRLRGRFPQAPLCAYQVSGEYSMIQAAGANGWIDPDAAMLETLTAIKRAGADMIITYFADRAIKALTDSGVGPNGLPTP